MKLIKANEAEDMLSKELGLPRRELAEVLEEVPAVFIPTQEPELIIWNEVDVGFCPNCMSRDYLYSDTGFQNAYCGRCGQKLLWKVEEG